MRSVINFLKRPFVNEQNTGRDAFQRYNGPVYEGVNGGAGFTVLGQAIVTSPAGIAPGPTHRLTDPSGTGNDNYNLALQPLSGERQL